MPTGDKETPAKNGLTWPATKAFTEFKDNLPRSVVPVVLTIIGTIAFASGNFVVSFFLEQHQLSRQVSYERERDIALERNTGTLLSAVTDYRDAIKHADLAREFVEATAKGVDANTGFAYSQRLRDALGEAEQHLGTLEGLSGMVSTLSDNWLTAEIADSTAEVHLLETALACANRASKVPAVRQECIDSILNDMTQTKRTLARTTAAGQVSDAHKSLWEADRELRWNQAAHRIDVFYVKLLASLFGLVVAWYAYGKLLAHFLETERKVV